MKTILLIFLSLHLQNLKITLRKYDMTEFFLRKFKKGRSEMIPSDLSSLQSDCRNGPHGSHQERWYIYYF